MIRLKNVYKTFPNGTVALDNVDLHIAKDEFVFLVGSNGAGKSTLLRMLYRADRPTRGEILIDQVNITKLPRLKFRTCAATWAWCFKITNFYPSARCSKMWPLPCR
jgi:ABC-type ATPase involved in cell division